MAISHLVKELNINYEETFAERTRLLNFIKNKKKEDELEKQIEKIKKDPEKILEKEDNEGGGLFKNISSSIRAMIQMIKDVIKSVLDRIKSITKSGIGLKTFGNKITKSCHRGALKKIEKKTTRTLSGLKKFRGKGPIMALVAAAIGGVAYSLISNKEQSQDIPTEEPKKEVEPGKIETAETKPKEPSISPAKAATPEQVTQPKPVEAVPAPPAPPAPKPVEAPPAPKPVEAPPAPKPVVAPPAPKPVEAPPAPKPVEAPPAPKPVEAPPAPVSVSPPVESAPKQGAPVEVEDPKIQSEKQIKGSGIKVRPTGDVWQGGPLSKAAVSVALAIQDQVKGFKFYTGLNDKFHKEKHPKSQHAVGQGLDFVLDHMPSVEESQEIKEQIKTIPGVKPSQVMNEYYNPPEGNKAPYTTGPHMHVGVADTASALASPSKKIEKTIIATVENNKTQNNIFRKAV